MHLWKRVEKIYWTYETDYQCITRNITRSDLIFRTPNEINVGLEIRPDPTKFYAESNITIFNISKSTNHTWEQCAPDIMLRSRFLSFFEPEKFVRHARWSITRDITTSFSSKISRKLEHSMRIICARWHAVI